ncbi:MAG: GntR family transcriptional regulator [Microbacterium sp. SCN 70-27]|mgnify:FL=1|uniref:GntR family transcriptional regulator n=1 Tax=unclassified Microbacterium TaxID=2609290 RepID=UPI00086A5C9C|nr:MULTISPECIES: GntR family transcriptional regulator [unclassified Microbacterium]MBN9223626.1 GntR family transcriptional regulator [Microbacterium sp.]ODT26972.1 MAG: GntR family transcriptional regulator [Microbacterium sp. SCN 70-27]
MSVILPPIDLAGGKILSDEVYKRIGAAILEGTLPAGVRLRDVDLAAQLGISRTPVREALQRLEHFGLVEIAVGRYTRVSEPTDGQREETGEFTAYFMGNALRMALRRCSDDELEILVAKADLLVAAGQQDAMTLFEASYVFFEAVTRVTGNSVFIGVISQAQLAIQRNLRGWEPFMTSPLERAEAYGRLRDAIARRDGDAAERELRWLHAIA